MAFFEASAKTAARPMPQRLFEIDNIIALDDSAETGAAEYRANWRSSRSAASGFATARSVVDALMRELGWKAEYKAVDHATFVHGRAAEVLVAGKSIGVLGEVHPEVLTNFGLTYPVALAELKHSSGFADCMSLGVGPS